MLFVELRFFAFFAIVFGVFWALRGNMSRKTWLLLASYVFYGAWDWRFLSLILLSTVVDFFVGKGLGRSESKSIRKVLLLVSLVLNLGLLGFFKYYGFFVESAVAALNAIGVEAHVGTLSVILPVGISFYTFQTLSYSIDIYRRNLKHVEDPIDFALFVAFFPQLVAGPIVRAKEFLPQLERPVRFGSVRVRTALLLFLFGFFKKACVSDNIAPFVDAYFLEPSNYDAMSAWIGVLLYAIQIYCDFSGYTDMAIACAALLGYRLTHNFAFPYFATSIQEFWRRWHISLSTWLRDYLYIPLGGSRFGHVMTYRNLMLTMLLGGLWHGAAWTFVVWGTLHGLALSGERASKEFLTQRTGNGLSIPTLLRWALTLFWVNIAWIFFRAQDFESAWTAVQAFALFQSFGELSLNPMLWVHIVSLLGLHYVSYIGHERFMTKSVYRLSPLVFACLYGIAWALIFPLTSVGNRPFIYFQF